MNYQQDSNDEDLQWWNYDLNREDIIHDAENIKELGKNKLFQKCLSEILTHEINEEEVLMDEDADATYFNPIKIPNASKKKPVQLNPVNFTIHDTYSGKKIGIPDKITPSYYFDPASRSYNSTVAKELETFINANRLLNTSINLEKYGFTNTTIGMNYQRISGYNYLVINVITHDDNFNIKITPNKGEYDPENGDYPYLGGNQVKAKFFKENVEKYNDHALVKHGKRFIMCKLLGDLLHSAFASNGDCVFTNDSYLRDRCIKNKVDVIHREICKKGMIDCIDEFHMAKKKGGGLNKIKSKTKVVKIKSKTKVVKSAKKELKTHPKRFNQVTIYYYYEKVFLGGGACNKQIGGSKNTPAIQNEYNKQNLLNYIDNYITKLNNFNKVLSFNVYGNNIGCSDNGKIYIRSLIDYLSSDCKVAINGISSNMAINEFNKELIKWFPQDILFYSREVSTEIRPNNAQYYSPTSVKCVFPYNNVVPYLLNYFTQDKISFDQFVTSKIKKPIIPSYTLNDILSYFDKRLSEIEKPNKNMYLGGSEELNYAIDLIKKLKFMSDLHNNTDFLILMNILIDSSFTSEDDLLIEYLKVICQNDEIKAYTIYTTLLPLTYFDGLNIYDYNILSDFVNTLGEHESLPGGYEAFLKLVIGNTVDEISKNSSSSKKSSSGKKSSNTYKSKKTIKKRSNSINANRKTLNLGRVHTRRRRTIKMDQ